MKVANLDPDYSLDEYAEAMAQAFCDYRVIVRAFQGTSGPRVEWVRKMVTASALERRAKGRVTPVAVVEAKVVGGAVLHFPGQEDEKSEWWPKFCEEAGPAVRDFYERFFEATESVKVPTPNLYLTMIGVHPDHQGQGVGRALIEHVVAMAREIPGVHGVALDTEIESNVTIYERCGFSVVGEAAVDDIPIWVMFRNL